MASLATDSESYSKLCENHWFFSYEHRRLAACHACLGLKRWAYQKLHMSNSLWVTLQMFVKSCCMYFFHIPDRMWATLKIFVKSSLTTSFHMTNREWVPMLHILWKGSLITFFPMTNREWVTLHICESQSHHIFPMTNREWVTLQVVWKQSHHIFSYNQQKVSDIAHFVKGSLITPLPMTNSKWVTLQTLWKQSHHIFSYNQQKVGDFAHFVKAISSHPFLWPTESEWHCTFCESQSHHIFSYDQQGVSDIAHFVKGNLITSFLMTNREWVTLYNLWKAVSLHLSLWSTVCSEWHCTFEFCERQSHHIFSYDQQYGAVSGMALFVKGSLITSFPITNRKWVTLHILWKPVSPHLFLWPTGSEWHCTFCESQSHHIFSYDQQGVNDIVHFVKGSLITSFPMTNRKWVILHILWNSERQSHIFSYDQQYVSDIAHFVKSSLIMSFPMTNSLWVTLHILWKAVSSHLFLWPTDSEWHCTFWKGRLIIWPTESE